VTTDKIVAVEALSQWQHPTRGSVSPDVFLPLAERTGLIHRIGGWVLEEACRHIGEIQNGLPDSRTLHLSVNPSPVEPARPTLAADVLDVLRRTRLNPANLVVTITGGALIHDQSAISQLAALRSQGVHVALDDFGTGYSSLRYPIRLPVDILKMDRCFVAKLNGDPEGAAVTDAIVRLSQILHMDATAEGTDNWRWPWPWCKRCCGCRQWRGLPGHWGR
jgi:EAL domain-containing protein (putative c-di-GMP-specific phosphodiesterase class I)